MSWVCSIFAAVVRAAVPRMKLMQLHCLIVCLLFIINSCKNILSKKVTQIHQNDNVF